ncbi:type I-E CRISPR-associated protein Cas6/Cse3/CasE [Scardovia wiggsiae]|mgnify:CR=1 FL=1|uniref:type I-E CRISPR-associated protein Cas6/Cse3/CasE n=1 Tax=Scardovia wiggsiae TaxID=230143 RepID=UPI003BAC1958
MFISRIPLNMSRIETQHLVYSPYRVHAAVEKAFPPNAVRSNDAGRILWRLDSREVDHSLWLYVVSIEHPDFSHIVERYGWPLNPQWETKMYDPLLNSVAIGQEWAFRLRANPVRQVLEDKGRRHRPNIIGHRIGHATINQQIQWLLRRSASYGFEVIGSNDNPECIVSQRRKEKFTHKNSTVTLVTAQFDGRLRILDAEKFVSALTHGIGRAKSFGCGLLTVAH